MYISCIPFRFASGIEGINLPIVRAEKNDVVCHSRTGSYPSSCFEFPDQAAILPQLWKSLQVLTNKKHQKTIKNQKHGTSEMTTWNHMEPYGTIWNHETTMKQTKWTQWTNQQKKWKFFVSQTRHGGKELSHSQEAPGVRAEVHLRNASKSFRVPKKPKTQKSFQLLIYMIHIYIYINIFIVSNILVSPQKGDFFCVWFKKGNLKSWKHPPFPRRLPNIILMTPNQFQILPVLVHLLHIDHWCSGNELLRTDGDNRAIGPWISFIRTASQGVEVGTAKLELGVGVSVVNFFSLRKFLVICEFLGQFHPVIK